MAKISTIFKLGKSQRELDFIDIDINKDKPYFLNPFVLSVRTDNFSIHASRTIKSFFHNAIELIVDGKVDLARKNFLHLNEPNETCLGLSVKKPQGRGMGEDNAEQLFDSILSSRAIQTGAVEDLEDTAIFVKGINRDKVSDMTTNIIRRNLIKYTQEQCALLNIPLAEAVPSGFYWDQTRKKWEHEYTDMLAINGRKILLVPKGVVSYVQEFDSSKYRQHHVLEYLQDYHLDKDTELVRRTLDKKGKVKRRFVYKKDIVKSENGIDKNDLLEFTKKHPRIFADFKKEVAGKIVSLEDSEFDSIKIDDLVNHLIKKLKSISPGNDGAAAYHSLMIGILELIFYPSLINPCKELEIHEGRKRLDISFDNGAPKDGFFYRLQHAYNIPCSLIPIECKNYSRDTKNPELDQMVGRLSPNRGKFGIIVCRAIEKESLFIQRCADSYKDDHGIIVPLTDKDIIKILEERKNGSHLEEKILSDKTRMIITG